MRLAEARHPVCVPSMSHQQLCRPEGEQSNRCCSENSQELTKPGDARPAESELEDRHPAGQRMTDCGDGGS